MRRLHPATMIVAFLPALKDAAVSLVPFVAVSFVSGKGDFGELILAGIGVLGGFGAVSTYLTTRYWIEDGHLKSTTGWLFKRDRQIPLEHIHNVNLRQNILERTLRVLTVEVETASGTTPELKLQVVTAGDAETLRSELLAGKSDEATPVGAEQEITLYRVPPADLWLGAVTENHFGHLILATLPFFGLGVVQAMPSFAIARQMVPDEKLAALAIGAFLLLAFAGWLVGAIGYAMRYARFRVLAEIGAYRISYGLFTRIQYSIRAARIEHLEASATVWQRWIRRTALHVATAGTFGEQGLSAPVALMLPAGDRDEALNALYPGPRFDALKWQRFPRFYLLVTSIRSVFGAAVVAAPILAIALTIRAAAPARTQFLSDIFLAFLALSALLLALAIVENFLSFPVSGYAIDDDLIAVRHGFFRRKTTYMPMERVEVVEIVQPLFWRKRGLVSMTATGMKHPLGIPMLDLAAAERVAERIRERSRGRQARRIAGLKAAPTFDL